MSSASTLGSHRVLLSAFLLALASCGGGGGGGGGTSAPPPPAATYSVGGTVTGLQGTGLVLRNNQTDSLTIAANGAFTFGSALNSGAAYAVTVATQPSSPVQSCSIANGSGTIASAAVTGITVTCAPASLTLTTSAPANGATAVARNTTFLLTFSAALDGTTVTSSSVTLSSPAGTETIQATASGPQILITPSAPLRSALPYTLTIGTAVRGTAGEAVTAPITVALTTADGTWATATAISPAATDAFVPKIQADATGGAVLAWAQSPSVGSATTEPWGARADSTGTWSSVQSLGGTMNVATQNATVDANGNAFVIWQESASPPVHVYVSRLPVGGTWTAAAPIDGGMTAVSPVIAADPLGNVIALWSLNPHVWSNRYTPAAGWGTPVQVNATDTVNINSRSLGVDGAGNAIAVWDSGLPGSTVNNYARYTPSTGWSESGLIPSASNAAAGAPQVVVDAAGNAIAAWGQNDGTRSNVWASRFTPQQGWGAPESIESLPEDTTLSSLAADSLGNAVAVFLQYEGARINVWASRYVVGTGWMAAEPLETGDADATNIVAAVETGGNIHTAWVQGASVWTNRYTRGGGWAGAVQTAPGGDQPSITVSATGRAYLAYAVSGLTRRIWARQFN